MTQPLQADGPYELVAAVLQCDPAQLGPDSRFQQQPGWDSFAQLGIVLALEERYGIAIADDDILKFASMAAIVQFCAALAAAGD